MSSKDPFTGQEIKFGEIIRVGPRRKDGKYPVAITFTSTGSRFNKIMTKEQIDADIQRSRRRGTEPQVYGYTPPPTTVEPGHSTKKKSSSQLDREIADVLSRSPSMTADQIARYRSGRTWGWPADLAFKKATGRPLSRTPGRRSHATAQRKGR